MPDWMFFVDDLEKICSPYCLQYWQTVGIWLTGFATLSAVLVSLTLARRQGPRSRVSAGIRMLVGADIPQSPDGKFPELLLIIVRNVGDRPAKIEGVGWRPGRWRKVHAYQTIPPQPSGVTLPHVLPEGDSLRLSISLDDEYLAWMKSFARDFLGRWPALDVRFLRVTVWTPAGHTFKGPLEDALCKPLLDEARALGAKNDTTVGPTA